MANVLDFIRWALTHADPNTIPKSATFVNGTATNIGKEPWHYLYGTIRSKTTKALIEERWSNFYSSHGWTRAAYDKATANFKSSDYATDCQGLLDAYFTYELGIKTDINANYNYVNWCTDKGPIDKITRPYVIGEALFMVNKSGNMTHIGWVCGFDVDGEPLVVEARGLSYGVVITRLDNRSWTHRGLMTKKFEYKEEHDMPIKIEKTSPMLQGEYISALQIAMNALGYADANGNELEVDGKCGTKTVQAVTAFANAHADCCTVQPVEEPTETISPIATFTSTDGTYNLVIMPTNSEV